LLLARAANLQRGKTYTTTVVQGGRPTTYTLCPACEAEDKRIATKDQSVYVRRQVAPSFIKNPIADVVVRRDEKYVG
jgi:hypothetical protein